MLLLCGTGSTPTTLLHYTAMFTDQKSRSRCLYTGNLVRLWFTRIFAKVHFTKRRLANVLKTKREHLTSNTPGTLHLAGLKVSQGLSGIKRRLPIITVITYPAFLITGIGHHLTQANHLTFLATITPHGLAAAWAKIMNITRNQILRIGARRTKAPILNTGKREIHLFNLYLPTSGIKTIIRCQFTNSRRTSALILIHLIDITRLSLFCIHTLTENNRPQRHPSFGKSIIGDQTFIGKKVQGLLTVYRSQNILQTTPLSSGFLNLVLRHLILRFFQFSIYRTLQSTDLFF